MFEQTFIDEPGRGVKPWTFAVSLALQCSLVAAAVLTPLVFTYELPVSEWLEHTLLVAPPPAPAPQATVVVKVVPKPPPRARFDEVIAPTRIPDDVALQQGVESLTEGLAAPEFGAMAGGAAGGLEGGVLGAASPIVVPQMPVRMGGRVQAARIIARVSPVYPAEALDQGLTGDVHLEAIITTKGTVRNIKVLSGDPVLAAAAVEAVQQWRYQPTFLNGRPVEVITDISVHFTFTEPEPPQEPQRKRRRKR